MKWEPRPAQDSFLKTDLPPPVECLRSAGIYFLGYNRYELPVKHRLEIPANHNSELDQKNKRRRKVGRKLTSALGADFRVFKIRRGNAFL